MRSRYTAYYFRLVDYIVKTNHPDTREATLREDLVASIDDPDWTGLTILSTLQGGPNDKIGKVKFVAAYTINGKEHLLEEHSRFRRFQGKWHYLDGRG